LRSGEEAERRGLHHLLTYIGTEFEGSLFQKPFRFLKVLIINGPGKPQRLLRVVYHLKTISGKSDWKVNGTRLFGRFSGKFPAATEHLKSLLFFWTEYSTRKFVFHFFKAIFDSQAVSGLRGRLPVNGTDRPVSNVVLLPCRTKLIEFKFDCSTTVARRLKPNRATAL